MVTKDENPSPHARQFVAAHDRSFVARAKGMVTRIGEDRVTDQAAALTYYTVFSAFPMLIALISVLKLVGQSERVEPVIDEFVTKAVPDEQMAATITQVVQGFLNSGGAGLGLVIGILLALWSASGYVGAFGRAANSLHGAEESRGFVKLKAQQLGLTAVLVLIMILVVVVFTAGPLVAWIGGTLGSDSGAARLGSLWSWLRWPVIAALLVLMVATLFRFAPDTSARHVPLVSRGSLAAILIALLAVVGFNIYVSGFGNYEKTYGALAGVIVALLLIWIVSIALLVGVLIDAEHDESASLDATGTSGGAGEDEAAEDQQGPARS
ncbi:membrane protein [Propionibacterium cyclohexanicum]|uniref:Membrane protein n=2 Tax=Propionibacterium cyclohexanicum TaxID=64702 RepID=A0A1H9Q3A0_9ACTN|nr:membrane protein [Propionibacterium cyclohexanicum]